MRKRKLLIIDDEEGLHSSLTTFLNIRRYETLAAASGEEGIEHIKEFKPELLLLDIHLSGGATGIEVLRAAMSIKPGLKVAILTGFGDEEEIIDECQGLGRTNFCPNRLAQTRLKRP